MGMMMAPAWAARRAFSTSIRVKGASRRHRISGRRSLSWQWAVRVIRLSPTPAATWASVWDEQGSTTIPAADTDPEETQEWLDSIDAVIGAEGPVRARFLMAKLIEDAALLAALESGQVGHGLLLFETMLL